jgi:hypothetical protein
MSAIAAVLPWAIKISQAATFLKEVHTSSKEDRILNDRVLNVFSIQSYEYYNEHNK